MSYIINYAITEAAAAAHRQEMLADAGRWRASRQARRRGRKARAREQLASAHAQMIDLRKGTADSPEILAAVCQR